MPKSGYLLLNVQPFEDNFAATLKRNPAGGMQIIFKNPHFLIISVLFVCGCVMVLYCLCDGLQML